MPTSMIIVDDFLDNAQALREASLRLTYPPQEGMFPGRNSVERIDIEGLAQQVSRLVGEPLEAMPPPQAHAKSRITLAADKGKAKVHVDAAHWSGILYLSRPQDCQGGTEFFRHRATNTDRAPYDDREAAALGYSSAKGMVDEILERDGTDDSKWEMTQCVPMRFNRLLLLRPWLWHTAGANFGDTLENGRLVYLMFFASSQR
ncbi:DUF6445 family protein [Pseudoxanthomonas sp. CF125]|uniref:DUF6445 family protein n=1 Tax=Pseudoxanthomonas sp. CF125 TaxID=1855303 RepID=UPI00088BD0FD|nr:DUF6445 family protein [Pseudoxanthomonas sp. CF125]SDQ26459.1 hypothetical protein SAMN05216569_0363 [Pseudoxanthomonas sp. CF125]